MDARLQKDNVLKALEKPEEFTHPTLQVITDFVRGNLNAVEKHLVSYPKAIKSSTSPLAEIFFWAALVGDYRIIQQFLARSLFNEGQMKKIYFREIINGCLQRANIYSQNSIDEFDIIEIAYDAALKYQEQIHFRNDADLAVYADTNSQLIRLYNIKISSLVKAKFFSAISRYHQKKMVCIANLDSLRKLNDAQLISSNESVDLDVKSLMISAAADWGFKYQEILQDGNCFFHAIIHQLEINKMSSPVLDASLKLHQYYRHQAVQVVRFNQESFYKYFDHTENFENYLATMEQSGEWADELMITALIAYLQVNLIIIKCDDNKPHIIKIADAAPTLKIGYQGNNHYVSLIGPVENAELCELIEKTSIMNMEEITPILEFKENLELTSPSSISRTVSPPLSQESLSLTPIYEPSSVTLEPAEKADNIPLLAERKSFETTVSTPTSTTTKPNIFSSLRKRFSNLFPTPADESVSLPSNEKTLGDIISSPAKR